MKALEQKSILFNYIIKWWLCVWNGRKTEGKAIQLEAYFRRPSQSKGGFDQGQGQGFGKRRCAGRSPCGRWSSQDAGASVAAISHVQGQHESPKPALCFEEAGRQESCSGERVSKLLLWENYANLQRFSRTLTLTWPWATFSFQSFLYFSTYVRCKPSSVGIPGSLKGWHHLPSYDTADML